MTTATERADLDAVSIGRASGRSGVATTSFPGLDSSTFAEIPALMFLVDNHHRAFARGRQKDRVPRGAVAVMLAPTVSRNWASHR